ncbi:hypothetical protein NW762_011466 [Fusarium torreyae]|uniref:DUF7726 domain-containing protein n=1 Tax=Fusarium torreyae TaxID=1237075 RepID=A0A9W8VCI4_9HYPO|nr:hypothetical protein NW762_011466 [Fusarium torreyae]
MPEASPADVLQPLDVTNSRVNQTPNKSPSKGNGPAKSSPAAKSTPTSGKKRKAGMSLDEEIAAYKQDLDHLVDRDSFQDDTPDACGTIRSKLNKLIDSGVMTKAELCRAIPANSNSLNKFLQQKGTMAGSGSCVWFNAYAWFKQREIMGIKMPNMKKRQLEQQKEDAAGASSAPGSAPKAKKPLPDISDIHLDGEESDEVPVYDTCDEIRRKINAHLKTPGLTQAQFCRDLYAQLHAPKCKGIQSKQLADFRHLHGSNAGAKGSVFYAAYVYFEKLRLAQGKPKSKHRQDMEGIHPGGFPRDQDHNQWLVAVGFSGMR